MSSEDAAVESQQLGARFASLPSLLRRLIDHLDSGKIWKIFDLLRQGVICPLDKFLEAFEIGGFFHRTIKAGMTVTSNQRKI